MTAQLSAKPALACHKRLGEGTGRRWKEPKKEEERKTKKKSVKKMKKKTTQYGLKRRDWAVESEKER